MACCCVFLLEHDPSKTDLASLFVSVATSALAFLSGFLCPSLKPLLGALFILFTLYFTTKCLIVKLAFMVSPSLPLYQKPDIISLFLTSRTVSCSFRGYGCYPVYCLDHFSESVHSEMVVLRVYDYMPQAQKVP